MRTAEIIILTLVLFLTGASLFAYRAFVLDFPLVPNRAVQSWHVEAKIGFNGTPNPARVKLYLPHSSPHYTIVDENFVSEGFALTTENIPETGNRVSLWTKQNTRAREIVYYRAILYQSRPAVDSSTVPQFDNPYPVFGTKAFREKAENETQYFVLQGVIEELREKAGRRNRAAFATHLQAMLDNGGAEDGRFVQLRERVPYLTSRAALEVYILQHAGIPARLMNGIFLAESARSMTPETWAEIFADGAWRIYDPATEALEIPEGRLGWWSGHDNIYAMEGGRQPLLTLSVKKHVENALTEAVWRGDPVREALYKISIFSLPVDVQLIFAVLLLVPVGALVISVLRQMVGVQTFGTFMPILVALAFRETQLFWGIVMFGTIIALGLVFRLYLNRLRLLMVPRLGAILTLAVMAIYILSLGMFNMDLHVGLSATLFPIVILAMLIERLSVTLEEYGMKEAMYAAAGSLFAAIISYFVMINDYVVHLVVTFPETLLAVLAVQILIGRYNGYKLTEFYRFRLLNTPPVQDGKQGKG
ncbi:MAG: hypothetical protein EA357_03040 [Micavibrio sp.]|nr:MAG: hypothetical protein EA357_03040 [Micavibrio sp.]